MQTERLAADGGHVTVELSETDTAIHVNSKTTLTHEDSIRMLREMMRIRTAEETIADLYKEQEMRTPTHFSIGQEAVAVGVCGVLTKDDLAYSGHRCHAHYLATGGDLNTVVS